MTVKEYIQRRGLSNFTEPVLSLINEGSRHMVDQVQVRFTMRAVRKLGTYSYGRKYGPYGTININRFLSPEDMDSTFLHELAHAISKLIYNYMGHGARWRQVMVALRQSPDRTSEQGSLAAHADASYRWVYTCKDCGKQFKNHRRLKNVQNRYHPVCRRSLHFGHLNEERAC